MDLKLTGKRALITGSSSGIGAGIARMLAEEGALVVVHGRSTERATEVASEITKIGGTAKFVTGDLESESGANDVAEAANAAFGGIDILVNNAGGRANGGAKNSWFELTAADWEANYNLNVLSTVRLILQLAKPMKERGWGRIINIGTVAAHSPSGGLPEYAVNKAGIVNLTLGLSKSLAKSGVTINCVSPGMTRTPALEAVLDGVANRQRLPSRDEAEAWMLKNILVQTVNRLGTPEDIASAVCYLASPRSDFVNGTNLHVDGGASAAIN